MIYTLVFLFLIICGLSYYVWGLSVSIRSLIIDAEYMRYCINFLSANSYWLVATNGGRELTEEEDLQLAFIQNEVSQEAQLLGMLDPFPRPLDITESQNLD